jgi:hypothetical protein
MLVRLAVVAGLVIGIGVPGAVGQTRVAPGTPPVKAVAVVAKPVRGKVAGSERFTTVAAAQASCPGDTVVWSSFTKGKSFHLSTSRYFGKTKHGAYVCQQAALAAGFHQARS